MLELLWWEKDQVGMNDFRNDLMQTKILCVERKRVEGPSFSLGLRKKGYLVESVLTGTEAINHLENYVPDLVIVNAASLRTNGKRICKALNQTGISYPIIVIISSEQEFGEEPYVNVVLRLPFTLRKLVNRIMPYQKSDPETNLTAGPISFDYTHRVVRCREKETRLTPRLAILLKLLMENKGEAITRENLFITAWKTQYTGDTRTLDVHISWLRRIIEEDPRHPLIIKTERGIGYRLAL